MMARMTVLAALAGVSIIAGCAGAGPGTGPGAGPGEQLAPGATLVQVYADKKFFECPVWDRAHGILYFDAYEKVDQLVRLDGKGKVTTMPATDGVGGAFLARDGRILAADCEGHRILSFASGPEGLTDLKVLASDPSWNQPNDLCQTRSGDIYITDPDFKNKKTGGVYHLSPAGKLTKVVSDLVCANGITPSNDGRTLYVSDSNRKEWWSYPILPDGGLGPGKLFFKPETKNTNNPDGMTIDEHGNLYLTGLGGVWIVRASGQKLDFLSVPEFTSNVRIGGPDGKTLYITCKNKVYSIALRVRSGGL